MVIFLALLTPSLREYDGQFLYRSPPFMQTSSARPLQREKYKRGWRNCAVAHLYRQICHYSVHIPLTSRITRSPNVLFS
ncbi:hypothetical protein SERLA73DRAFT_184774 [Serpula lacrymans var. lacrymans S7.3]|uniref:Uncharacterized protein n=1 Tax=Serpula lacrymans var. lacrymans (strain S7.3) TaxID=936435 RepID=F8Q535_SERL3|nr:hypothetical protein SERLA73DRAFT_184774 [Serpula lacrymans var. lacrymans S7.3]